MIVIIQKGLQSNNIITSPPMYDSLHPNFSSTANVAPNTESCLHVRFLATNMFLKTQ